MQTKKSSITKTKIKDFKPNLFKVMLLNDEVTTMDFVVMILIDIFNKSKNEAIELMLKIHQNGRAICGIYTKEIAQTKQMEVLNLAKANGFPLKCVIEEE
ncbi:ATP-dependent Clp protease adaptor ClpS [Campylobacter fetus]|uniref:ATP-dependent Clp protease adapter protein ClpS n=1 Tax=Campylobacter fetus subsp. testudinum TaxID=1507806 RepID=A0AAX0HCT6_CAMFE|nr:ATP-dependent Clp protease adaptor ClpS [Campylobacter fetus]AGZ81568.1 ATP-dependent Clp protease adaptor protein ClpS [Campylobacter fetus subsp. testudinum 03-427]ALV64728.1 ATP-dependent Clp protease adaptor protein ClpS [Campylobacter fetus subsp. testudinum Sp3]AVK80976.1 ATP-dependent Clp protease adaptor ClpS [Campylobacter fetus subsp. testudinum]EAI4321455.1 ATP-dependent Clp protease adaptor ClpS [Campylobacter fetus]EAI4390711.1 ATP-dependent Clp protease adaptor ClpS [Campyloba